MAAKTKSLTTPAGGVFTLGQRLNRWAWHGRAQTTTDVVTCRPDEWYLLRARPVAGTTATRVPVIVQFLRNEKPLETRCIWLHSTGAGPGSGHLLGWVQSPLKTNRVRIMLPDPSASAAIAKLTFHVVSERDPKCHPMANVPRWSDVRPAWPIQRIVLPASLAALGDHLPGAQLQIVERPASLERLKKLSRGAACVLGPAWIRELNITLSDVEQMAHAAWMLVDLDSAAKLLRAAGRVDAQLFTHASDDGIMCARIEYGDVLTRGFAMQDVLPFSTLIANMGFAVRALHANRAWRKYADRVGLATILSGEMPWTQRHADIITAAQPIGHGELIFTDLPWLVAGEQGTLLAPHVAAHLLRMHLARPLAEPLQYWNRWEDSAIVVRDLFDLARRYPPLQTARWQSRDRTRAHLGLSVKLPGVTPARHTMIQTGSIDHDTPHDGLPPEALAIFMKWLAREAREETAWAREHLADQAVTWQFDTTSGLKHSISYDGATALATLPTRMRRLRIAGSRPFTGLNNADLVFDSDEGLYGDRALEFQRELTAKLLGILESRDE